MSFLLRLPLLVKAHAGCTAEIAEGRRGKGWECERSEGARTVMQPIERKEMDWVHHSPVRKGMIQRIHPKDPVNRGERTDRTLIRALGSNL